MDAISAAKELFLKYGGNFFHMDREGEYKLYQSFGVSKEQEEAWMEEYRGGLLRAVETEDEGVKVRWSISALLNSIRYGRGYEDVSRMLAMIGRKTAAMDSFSQLLIAEFLATFSESHTGKPEATAVVAAAKATAVELLQRVIRNPVKIAQEDLADPYLTEVVRPPERIVERARKCLPRVRKRWFF